VLRQPSTGALNDGVALGRRLVGGYAEVGAGHSLELEGSRVAET
jgi:hypothetical protein